MIFEHHSKTPEGETKYSPRAGIKVLLVAPIVLLVGGISYMAWSGLVRTPEPVSCTLEAKLCPDGSYVGRTGPNCEFSPCPSEAPCTGDACLGDLPDGGVDVSWKTFSDDERGISFRYPESPVGTYSQVVDWPPQVQVLDQLFTCTEAGSETARAGLTQERLVRDRTYCVTKVVEGAAGSIYTQYAYAFSMDTKTVIFTFSIRDSQCGNYANLEKTACEYERSSFDLDSLVDRVARTFQVRTTVPDTSKSGIQGVVLLGPTCPVVMDPPDPVCADKPYKTKLVLTTADQSQVITEFSSDENGRFKVSVQPGEYVIRSAVAANILPDCTSNDTIQVRVNDYTDTVVSCDTGIR